MTHASRSLSRRFARLAVLLGAGAATLIPVALAAGTTPVGDQFQLSSTGPEGDNTYDAVGPSSAYDPRAGRHLMVWSATEQAGQFGRITARFVDAQGTPVGAAFTISDAGFEADGPRIAHNAVANEYLVVFERTTGAVGEVEIYAQRLSASGAELGGDTRISTMGPEGGAGYNASDPAVAVNEARNEYLVAWQAADDAGARVAGEEEIHVQRLSASGAQVGTDDQRVSDMGPDGDATYDAQRASVAWNERRDEYMVVWSGDDNTAPYVNGELEIRGQRLSGDGTELGNNDRRVSDVGPPGDTTFRAQSPAIVHNPATDEYLVAWSGDDNRGGLVAGEFEILVQRLAYDGVPVGADDQRLSDMGPDGSIAYAASAPRVSVNERANEYLVAWTGDDNTAPLVEGKNEVFVQRLSASGAELDGNDIRVSATPNEGDVLADATLSGLSHDSGSNQYLLSWSAEPNTPPLPRGGQEVFARRFGAGTPVSVASQCKVLPPQAPPPAGDPSKITLSVDQLLINQRIDQAAIRRANGVQAWIDAGVESRDLCQAALGAEELYPGSAGGYTAVPATYGAPDPRPVQIPAATPGDPSKVTLTIDQLLINQRISQAAIRRLNALKARLDAGLTSGDIDDGAVGRAQLKAGTSVLYVPVVATPPAASVTTIAPPSPGDPSKVTLSVNQLLINQRISQAAVKRANDLIYRLGQGIGPEEVRNGTLTTADLAPGLPLSTTP